MDFQKKIKLFFAFLLFFCLTFAGAIILLTDNKWLIVIAIAFASIVVLLFLSYMWMFNRYMKGIFVQLSELIASITDLRETEVFSPVEDTMLSKLQVQVLKLSNILRAQNERAAQDRNEIKSLISDISHQLKTPIANIRMYGELLEDESLSSQEQQEFNEMMKRSLDKLNFLVESMIKMSRLEGGVIELKPERASLNETLLTAIKQVYQIANKKQIQITFGELDHVQLKHDRKWTTECLVNMLDNAIKYTSEMGRIDVTIQSYEMFARIDITDNGIGIRDEEQAKVFRRFYRGSNVAQIDGIGIGLYLSREIIAKQGGYIKVKSRAAGSTFSLFLPL